MSALSKMYSKAGAGAIAVAVVLGSLLGIAAVAAQTGPTQDCSGDSIVRFGDQFFGLDDFGNRLFSTSPSSRQFLLPEPLSAGTYDLSAVSYDGYAQRDTVSPQPEEQWFAEFLAADGSVLATSGTTEDVPDSVIEGSWAGSLGSVTLSAEATQLRIVHAAPGSVSVNSVRPVCVGMTAEVITPDPVPAESEVVVDYDSDASTSSSVTITCGDDRESAMGDTIDLNIPGVVPGSTCTVSYSDAFDCDVIVDPTSAAGVNSDGVQEIIVPTEGGTTITVDVDCTDAVASPVTTAPAVTTAPTTAAPAVTTTTIAAEVLAQTETTAPASAQTATAQDGDPAFTG